MRNLFVLPLHGVGGRSDLPIPFALAVTAGAVTLLVSFVALALLWSQPRLGRPSAGWPLRVLGLTATGYVLVAAVLGVDDAPNPTAGVVFGLLGGSGGLSRPRRSGRSGAG